MSGVQQAVFQNQRSFGAPPDAEFNYVTMLLHGDGTNGAQNNTFLDSGPNTFTITRNGNTTQGSFSPYGSNWSNYFDSSGTYFSLGTNSAYNFSTGSWTYECWVNLSGTSTSAYYTVFSNGWPIQVYVRNNAFELYVGTSNSSSGQIVNGQTTSANSVPVGSWVHFALVRNSSNNTYKMYVNGVEQASTTDSTNPASSTTNFVIGAFGPNPTSGSAIRFLGYISNFRATASAVYTGTFTPSTTPLTAISGTGLLTCQSNRFVDNSASPLTITVNGNPSVQRFNPFGASTAYDTSVIGGSGYFDGSGDYLGCGSQSAYAFGTGDFTLNAWFYLTSAPTYMSIADTRASGWALAIDASRAIYLYSDAVGYVVTSAVGAVPLNAWTYVSVKRVSGTATLYLNAVSINSAANSTNFSNTTLTVGANGSGGEPFFGYICDFQAIKGTGTTPTLPTAPLTNVTNTSLLLNYTNGAIFDNAMMNDLETVGNAQISTSVYKYGTGSMYFDGNGDNLAIPTSPNLNMGTGNFTVECWVYISSRTLNYPLIFGNNNSGYGAGAIALTNSNVDSSSYNDKFVLSVYDIASPTLVASSTNSSNTWYHLAVVRNGTSLVMYRDGTSVASATISSNAVFDWGKLGSRIGGGNWDGAQSYFNGYIDDLRITRGYARYTANFTPPTAAFPNTGPY